MIGGNIYKIKPIVTDKYTYLVSGCQICQFSHILNRINKTFQPTNHQILSIQNIYNSETLILVYNKKRVITYDTISKQSCNFVDYPEDSTFLTAYQNIVVLQKEQTYTIYQFADSKLIPLLSDQKYCKFSLFKSKPSIFLQIQNNQLYVANGKKISMIDLKTHIQKDVLSYQVQISCFSMLNDIIFAGLVDGTVQINHKDFNLRLQYHVNAVVSILPIPCSSGLPILYTSDFTQNIAKWTGQRKNYVKKIIGPFVSSVYDISYGQNLIYVQLDCNKISVYEEISQELSFTLSSISEGKNSLSSTKNLICKLRNDQLYVQNIPGTIDKVQQIIGNFYVGKTIFIYNAFSRAEQVYLTPNLPQIVFFEVKNDIIISILAVSNEFYNENKLIISSTNGSVLYSISNVVPGTCTGLVCIENKIFVGCESGILEFELENQFLRQIGFYQAPNSKIMICKKQIVLEHESTWKLCEIHNSTVKVSKLSNFSSEKCLIAEEGVQVIRNSGAPAIKILKKIVQENLDVQQIQRAMLDDQQFVEKEQFEVMIGQNKKFQLNYTSHSLPDGTGVLNWIMGE